MNVEGGGSAGVGGPSVGGEFGLGVSFGSTIVNEGPVAPAFLEGTMPLSLNAGKPAIEIISNPFKGGEVAPGSAPILEAPVFEPLRVSEVLTEAESIIRGQPGRGLPASREVSAQVSPGVILAPRPMAFIWTEPAILYPQHDVLDQPQTKIALGRAVSTEPRTNIAQSTKSEVVTLPHQQILEEEEVITEKKVVESEETEVEEIEELRLKYLLDEAVSAERVYELDQAIELAGQEIRNDGNERGDKEVEGWRIVKFLRLHTGLISQIAKHRGIDGSLDETVEDLLVRKFASRKEAKEKSREIVAQNEPVRRGKEGKTVREGAVERVLKFPFIKRGIPTEVVVARVVKKTRVQAAFGSKPLTYVEQTAQVKEPSIEDFPDLAEVFRKV